MVCIYIHTYIYSRSPDKEIAPSEADGANAEEAEEAEETEEAEDVEEEEELAGLPSMSSLTNKATKHDYVRRATYRDKQTQTHNRPIMIVL